MLLTVEVNEIGVRSSCMDFTGRCFGIGTTFAAFQHSGNTPCLMDALKIWLMGSDIAKA
jgi:hypothetical protein